MKNVFKFKIIGLSLFSMFFFSSLQAQSETRIGVRGGVLFSNQDFKSGLDINSKAKLGLDLAVVADFPVGEVLNISPEIHWLQKGSKIEDISGDNLTYTLNYVEVPVLLKFKFGGTDVGFSVFGGPSFGYLLDGNDNITLNDYKKIEIGLHAGAGVALGPLVIDLRYLFGVSNISDTEIEVRNNGLGAGVSLMF